MSEFTDSMIKHTRICHFSVRFIKLKIRSRVDSDTLHGCI